MFAEHNCANCAHGGRIGEALRPSGGSPLLQVETSLALQDANKIADMNVSFVLPPFFRSELALVAFFRQFLDARLSHRIGLQFCQAWALSVVKQRLNGSSSRSNTFTGSPFFIPGLWRSRRQQASGNIYCAPTNPRTSAL